MRFYDFMQVDAFTTVPLEGNPCAIFFECDDLDDTTMLALAREMNLSETVFVQQSRIADFKVRYFTPCEEIPLAGHPTIATTFALIETGRFEASAGTSTLVLELKEGPIRVDVQVGDNRVERITMNQRKPLFGPTYTPDAVMPAFGLAADDVLPEAVIQTVSTGTRQLMVPVRDLATLEKAQLNIPCYDALKANGDFFSPHLFCLEGKTPMGQTYARHFGTPPDLIEDPFTGSATGAMAAYLWHHGLLEHNQFVAEQGHGMERPGTAYVEIVGPHNAIETVRVGGAAVSVLEGRLRIP